MRGGAEGRSNKRGLQATKAGEGRRSSVPVLAPVPPTAVLPRRVFYFHVVFDPPRAIVERRTRVERKIAPQLRHGHAGLRQYCAGAPQGQELVEEAGGAHEERMGLAARQGKEVQVR